VACRSASAPGNETRTRRRPLREATHHPENQVVAGFALLVLDKRSGELRMNETRIRLQDQPLQILVLLLEHAGELVTREQIQKRLWASDTFVDFNTAINSAMRKLREALSDNSGDPRFIETMARRGYRFIGTSRRRRSWLPNRPRYLLRGNRERLWWFQFAA
jgi:DNA-binding winged helix-turn-helix (wHTH) protein